MPANRRALILESCLLCDRLAPARLPLVRSPELTGHEKAPAQRRIAPVCVRCHDLLERAGARGLIETESGARWTLAAALDQAQPAPHATPA
jgi:hypothetical protein